jgi:hypothetical protein
VERLWRDTTSEIWQRVADRGRRVERHAAVTGEGIEIVLPPSRDGSSLI